MLSIIQFEASALHHLNINFNNICVVDSIFTRKTHIYSSTHSAGYNVPFFATFYLYSPKTSTLWWDPLIEYMCLNRKFMRKTICYEITLNHGCSCMLALFVPLIRECRLITSVAELQKSSIAHNLLTVHVSRRNTLLEPNRSTFARKSAKNNRHGFIAHHRFSTHTNFPTHLFSTNFADMNLTIHDSSNRLIFP